MCPHCKCLLWGPEAFLSDQARDATRSRLGSHGPINKALHVCASDAEKVTLNSSLLPEFTTLFYSPITGITHSMFGDEYSRCTLLSRICSSQATLHVDGFGSYVSVSRDVPR